MNFYYKFKPGYHTTSYVFFYVFFYVCFLAYVKLEMVKEWPFRYKKGPTGLEPAKEARIKRNHV